MISNDDRTAGMARYVGGRMDADERRRFEDELRADPDLRKMTEAESLIQRVAAAGRASLEPVAPASRERFQRLVDSLPDAAPRRRSGSSSAWIHLSIDLLLVTILVLTLRTPPSTIPPEMPDRPVVPAQIGSAQPAPSLAPRPASRATGVEAGTAVPADTVRRDSAPAARRSAAPVAKRGATSGGQPRPAGQSAAQSTATSDSLPYAVQPHTAVIGSDSTALPMSLRPPKINQKRNRP